MALDPRGQLLRAAVGFTRSPTALVRSRTLGLRAWLDSRTGIGHVVVGMHREGYDLQLTRLRARLVRDVLHDRNGALAHERDRHRVGADAVARDAAGAWEALTIAE